MIRFAEDKRLKITIFFRQIDYCVMTVYFYTQSQIFQWHTTVVISWNLS